jgi:hypothetical protein
MEYIALLAMAQDLAQHISQIIQMTVGKYAQILTHTLLGSTSPYAISSNKVQQLSHSLYMSKQTSIKSDARPSFQTIN